jgi:hypothetical protein
MNLYAASVALLWTTAMSAPSASRVRAYEQAPHPAGQCAASRRDHSGGRRWRRWGRSAP